ncbi:monovalent cation/H(+) antiporter subunit G [Paramicrobacterium agarici]|uniref:Multisubunit sodium/proton antiporter MrpG subunit n=1 Tax=Paramicrobacterium agarici TaxID=630514 RepID=A0A2A9E1E6_9MICO|nr:monovalent cation/H(+) antiporter subunit G [Microbacterium agarici]PFG32019.1 multisubunit sodium/proton antiporter MrpG subunit [Microbacterium agarici]TQO21909.1 multisubunit sodium/proton antiporter MrpG subunit [Microbacterium agarici]
MTGEVRDWITMVLVLVAAVMCLAAGIGLLRMPDVLTRLHAATKPQILGLIAMMADIALNTPAVVTITMAIAIIFFQGLTAPISAHMVGRAGYRAGSVHRESLLRDDLARRIEQAERTQKH